MNYLVYKRSKLEWLKLIAIWLAISVSFGLLFYQSMMGALIILPFGIVFEKVNRKRLIEKRKKLKHQLNQGLEENKMIKNERGELL